MKFLFIFIKVLFEFMKFFLVMKMILNVNLSNVILRKLIDYNKGIINYC